MKEKQLFSIKPTNEQMLVTPVMCNLEQPFPQCVRVLECACARTQGGEKREGESKFVVEEVSKTQQRLTPSWRITRRKRAASAWDGTPLLGNKPPQRLVAENKTRVSSLWLSWPSSRLAWALVAATVNWQVSWGLANLGWPHLGDLF